MNIKNLNDILKLEPHTPKRLSDEEILKLWKKPVDIDTDMLFISGEKGIEKFREVLDEYEKNKMK
jgi:hypothetical protein